MPDPMNRALCAADSVARTRSALAALPATPARAQALRTLGFAEREFESGRRASALAALRSTLRWLEAEEGGAASDASAVSAA